MKSNIITLLFLFSLSWAIAQTYNPNDFVGTWNGTYSSDWSYYENEPISMTIFEDGFYVETPGYFMPTLYPNTQQFEYDIQTNRLHWWYLSTVYAGQPSYTHIFYEIVSFDGYELVLHYNFWDDPEPNPEAGILILFKENEELNSPNSLEVQNYMGETSLSWNAPVNLEEFESQFEGYNVYGKSVESQYSLVGSTENESFSLNDYAYAGANMYYVTAKYSGMETDATNIVSTTFYTPEPENFTIESDANNVFLSWNAPSNIEMPIAKVLGYNIYYKSGYNDFELLEFVESEMFYDYDLDLGIHSYFVTTVYLGGESDPSQTLEASVLALGIEDFFSSETDIYPNPASNYVNISSTDIIENIDIYNHVGQVILSNDIYDDSVSLNIDDLKSGVYIFVVKTSSGTMTERVFVE